MVQKYSIFAAIQRNDVMRNAYLINLVRVLRGLPVSGDSTAWLMNVSTNNIIVRVFTLLAPRASFRRQELQICNPCTCTQTGFHQPSLELVAACSSYREGLLTLPWV